MDKDRRASVIRMAARYVAEKERDPSVKWAPLVRVTPLDAEGNPAGKTVSVGPVILW